MQVSNNGIGVINVTATEQGYYYMLVLSLESNKQGLIDINLGQYTNCPVAGNELRATQNTNIAYNTFTCYTSTGGDPIIWLVDGPSEPGKIVFYNDDYQTTEPHDVKWWANARIKRKHTQPVYGVILSEYSAYAPTGLKTDVYAKCKNLLTTNSPYMKLDDTMISAPGSSSYNCIAYTGGNQRNLSNGYYQYVWNHTNNPSGVYLVRYVVNGVVNVKKVVIQ